MKRIIIEVFADDEHLKGMVEIRSEDYGVHHCNTNIFYPQEGEKAFIGTQCKFVGETHGFKLIHDACDKIINGVKIIHNTNKLSEVSNIRE